jgi:hypothetical protein
MVEAGFSAVWTVSKSNWAYWTRELEELAVSATGSRECGMNASAVDD